jgi:hypothetical protein
MATGGSVAPGCVAAGSVAAGSVAPGSVATGSVAAGSVTAGAPPQDVRTIVAITIKLKSSESLFFIITLLLNMSVRNFSTCIMGI